MNIFKVLASGDRRFPEEASSSLLAWLLSPQMEHGLGRTFLDKFLRSIVMSIELPTEEADQVYLALGQVDNYLRFDGVSDFVTFEMYLEKRFEKNVIDILIRLDRFWIAIENKLYDTSINSQKMQLQAQYNELRKWIDDEHNGNDPEIPHRIISVFLVPNPDNPQVRAELAALEELNSSDFCTLFTWQSQEPYQTSDSDDFKARLSVSHIIRDIIGEELHGRLEPVPEYTRHTLKALVVFIENGFSGYIYERRAKVSRSDYDYRTFAQLEQANGGAVGIQYGESGLLRQSPESIRNREYAYDSDENRATSKNWVSRERFFSIANWLLGKAGPPEDWSGQYMGSILYLIAKSCGDSVAIGVQGGEEALSSLTEKEIRSARWEIANERKSDQWVPGSRFVEIFESAKGPTRNEDRLS